MSYVTLPSVSVLCSSHRPALTLARCSVAAHCASLRVLATPALRASDVWPSRLCRLASSHRPALTLARCSVAAHCASLRVLATPALRASDVWPSRLCRLASSHRPALTLARCSVAAHCASLRVLATPALRASDVWPSRLSVQHGRLSAFAPPSPVSPAHSPLAARGYGPAYFRASPSKLPGPSRPLASLTAARCSGAADALWACSTIRYGRSASLASSLAALPTSLGLLRAASPTGRALRAPLAPPAALRPSIAHCARPPCAPRPSTPSGLRRLRPVSRTARGLRAPLLNPSVAAAPRHIPLVPKGGFWAVLLPAAYHYPKGSP